MQVEKKLWTILPLVLARLRDSLRGSWPWLSRTHELETQNAGGAECSPQASDGPSGFSPQKGGVQQSSHQHGAPQRRKLHVFKAKSLILGLQLLHA